MVGPDFYGPPIPNTKSYTKKPIPKKTASTKDAGKAGARQNFAHNADIPLDWWKLYKSKELNFLIEEGLKNSPTLDKARATLIEAQENLTATWTGLLLPASELDLAYERTRFSTQQFGLPAVNLFNLYNTQVNVSYTLDVLGGSRRQIESTKAYTEFQAYEFLAAQLTLTSNIVTTAVTSASLREQITVTKSLIKDSKKQLSLIKKQLVLGGVSKENVLAQETQLAQTIATLPPLEKSLANSDHALAVLIGCSPGDAKLPKIKLSDLTLPKKLPVSIPSQLLKQRPDVKAAEALLHQASAEIGVATANLLPTFPIVGGYGYLSDQLNTLFTSFGNVWAYGFSAAQPLSNLVPYAAKRRAAIAAYDASLAQYRETVIEAFKNVADSLRAIEYDAEKLKAETTATNAAYETLKLNRSQFKLGAIDYINLLSSEQQYQKTVINKIQAQAARYNDTAALFQALGGGWWNCGRRCE